MAKKQANGKGNIRKRKNSFWEGRCTAGYDPETGQGHPRKCSRENPDGGQREVSDDY